MVFALGVLILGSMALSIILTAVARSAGRRLGLLDTPGAKGHHKPEVRAVPNTGGIAVFWSIAIPMLAGLAAAHLGAERTAGGESGGLIARLPSKILEHLPGIRSQTPMALALLGCMLAVHLIGVVDDRKALKALPKLGVILGAGAVLALFFDVRLLEFLGAEFGTAGAAASVALTVLWFGAVTNAMNFIDNMDGLCAGVAATAATFFLVTAVTNEPPQWFVAMALCLLLGSAAGFLMFNFPRRGGATIFMGDSGSLVIGFLLAFLTVRTTYYAPAEHGDAGAVGAGGWHAVFMPLCVLAVPLYDLASVTAIRLSQGKSPFVGDQQHFSHRLRARGLSVRQTLAVITGCTAITGISGIALAGLEGWRAALAGAQVLLTLGILGLYEHASSGRPKEAQGT